MTGTIFEPNFSADITYGDIILGVAWGRTMEYAKLHAERFEQMVGRESWEALGEMGFVPSKPSEVLSPICPVCKVMISPSHSHSCSTVRALERRIEDLELQLEKQS